MKTPASEQCVAYSYLRFSSPAQAEGDSVRRQTALRDGWLKRNPNVRLDGTLIDPGVSGFAGAHRTDHKHALARFFDQVERGRVLPGSYLIVENLDRLTREDPEVSIPLVLNLIRAGVRVVQLAPAEMVYESGMDFGRLMMMLWDLARGHGESKRKSGLCGAAWAQKKEEARVSKKPHGGSVPAWIEEVDGVYRIKEDAARAVRLIFRWSAEGLGTLAITQKLRDDGIPTIGRSPVWVRSYVAKILDNRAVLGEYQPCKGHHGREAEGDPVPGYFPAVITEAEWHAAHEAKHNRNKRSGRPGKKGETVYPFSGLLMCARDRCRMHVITRKTGRQIVSYRAVAHGERDRPWVTFPHDVFVKLVLDELEELQGADLFEDPGAGKVGELTGRLGEVERRLAVALAQFDADPESPTWSAQVSKYDREKRALVAELAQARREAASPLSASWADAVAQMAEDDPARLRAALLAVIEDVWCLVVGRERARLCAVQVCFRGQGGAPGAIRRYLLYHRQADRWTRGQGGYRPQENHARSFADANLPAGLDLREPAHVEQLRTALENLDLS